jgi:hypothetical protein
MTRNKHGRATHQVQQLSYAPWTKPACPALSIGLVLRGPIQRFSGLAEAGRAFEEQAGDCLAAPSLQLPRKELLDDVK